MKLSDEHSRITKLIAVARYEESRKLCIYDRSGARKQYGMGNLEPDLIGARGELLIAKFLDIPYTADINTFHSKPDVGPFEIRTASEAHHSLILRKADFDIKDRVFILIVQESCRTYRIVGWMVGKDGMRSDLLDSFNKSQREPAYRVPQKLLNTDLSYLKMKTINDEHPFRIIIPSTIKSYRDDPRSK